MRKLLASLRFPLISAAQNFRRNLAVSLAGVFTMGLILFLVGGVLLLTHSVNAVLDDLENKQTKMKIYVQDGTSLATILAYKSQLEHDPRIRTVSFESKDAAAVEFGASAPTLHSALETIGNNPLPASLNIEVRQIAYLDGIAELAKASPIIDQRQPSSLNQKVIHNLQDVVTWIERVGIALAIVLMFVSVVIIMNTIRTAVFVRRAEIEIMKLVGASDWFVRCPFILEGVLGGVLAAVFSGAIVTAGYRFLVGQAHGKLLFFSIPYDTGFLLALLGGLALAGMGIGAFGSFLGVRRFLAV